MSGQYTFWCGAGSQMPSSARVKFPKVVKTKHDQSVINTYGRIGLRQLWFILGWNQGPTPSTPFPYPSTLRVHVKEDRKGYDVWPNMVFYTWNLCSAFNPSKCTHIAVRSKHTHTHTQWTHTQSSGQPMLPTAPKRGRAVSWFSIGWRGRGKGQISLQTKITLTVILRGIK